MGKPMVSSLRVAVVTLIAGLLLSANAHAESGKPPESPRPNPVVAGLDLVLLRPLGLVATAVGAVLFVPAALLTAPNGRDGFNSALQLFVTEPAKNVFQRPLGEL